MKVDYSSFIMKKIPTILSNIDRNRYSLTYGCCDRNYWHYKMTDFSSSILQQTALTLSLIYKYDFNNNIYYNNKEIFNLSVASIKYLCSIQLRDGSFNEYYPNEHSFPATAFNLYTMAKSCIILGIEDKKIETCIRKATNYLLKNIECNALNQEFGVIAGLFYSSRVLNDSTVYDKAYQRLNSVLKLQKEEGWFSEYDGFDSGYLSVTLDMMMEIYDFTKDKNVLDSANKIIDFIEYFVEPNQTIGGFYNSRDTIYFLPFGIEYLSKLDNKKAIAIRNDIYENIELNSFNQESIDQRYFLHFVTHSYIRSILLDVDKTTNYILPYKSDFIKYFKEASIYIYRKNNIYLIISLNKGGILKLYIDNKLEYLDYLYIINKKKCVYTSNWQNMNNYVSIKDNTISIDSNFYKTKKREMTTITHFTIRILSFIFGRRLINVLKNKSILLNTKTNIKIKRKITITDKIIIEDIYPVGINIIPSKISSFRHVASSNFYDGNDYINNSEFVDKYINGVKYERNK
ncbi:MAG: hypothetical protein PHQ64_02635 [Bacilli bacterium]|nr:hypothetical protein [Bacilli bacterium]